MAACALTSCGVMSGRPSVAVVGGGGRKCGSAGGKMPSWAGSLVVAAAAPPLLVAERALNLRELSKWATATMTGEALLHPVQPTLESACREQEW